MTKEELDIQKEIENYFTESTGFGRDKIKNFMDIVNKALRQKGERIEELEQKLEQTEKDLADYQFNYPKIKELEKENAELKKELKDANEKVVHLACNQNKDLKYKLIQAKELLERFLGLGNLWNLDCKDYFPLRKEVERFLEK